MYTHSAVDLSLTSPRVDDYMSGEKILGLQD